MLRKSSNLLNRKPWVRRVLDSDMRWLWAGYKVGMWRNVLSGELSTQGFEEKALEVIAAADYDWIIDAPGPNGMRPVALVLGRNFGTGIEPSVEWFPWATNRNKLEATAAFLKEIPKQLKVFVLAANDSVPFLVRFVRYGMIRRGCKIVDYFSRGEDGMLFYTAGPR